MAARTSGKTSPQRRTVLYVEDDAAAIEVAREVVGQRDLVLVIAADMERALTVARRRPPEVWLINLDLVGVGAASLIRILRAHPAIQAAPLLALGRDAAREASVKTVEAGFFQYLVRPLDAGHLAAALDYALEFSALERAEL